jgi:hypothetical protein
MHVIIIVGFVLWIDTRPKGIGDQADRAVGIAVAHRMADRTEYQEMDADGSDEDSGSNSSANASAAAAAVPPSAAQPLDIEGLLAAVTDTPMPESGGGIGAALQATSGAGTGTFTDGEGGTPKAKTMFFGVAGSGRRFAYVFDRSESMKGFGGRPFRAAKSEFLSSIDLLGPDQAFQIIFYNNRPSYFDAAGFFMLPADDSMKRRASNFVRNMDAFGGTEHFDALRMALRLSPDVIFFLTDARIPQLNSRELDQIRNRAAENGTTIHAIEFGTDFEAPKESFLRTLASDNHGEYRYLNVQTLGQ